MTVAAAVTQLLALSVTGVTDNSAVAIRPPGYADLPVLRLQAAGQLFVEGLKAWNVAATAGSVTIFYDHMLLISGPTDGRNIDRWDSRLLYLDRYLAAITGDLTLDNNLTEPLSLILLKQSDNIQLGKNFYNGLVFRHRWVVRT